MNYSLHLSVVILDQPRPNGDLSVMRAYVENLRTFVPEEFKVDGDSFQVWGQPLMFGQTIHVVVNMPEDEEISTGHMHAIRGRIQREARHHGFYVETMMILTETDVWFNNQRLVDATGIAPIGEYARV